MKTRDEDTPRIPDEDESKPKKTHSKAHREFVERFCQLQGHGLTKDQIDKALKDYLLYGDN